MFDKFYLDWNYKRIKKIIDHFGHQSFLDKTVLDLGCGHADLSGALARLGARVIAVDVRQDHLNVAKKKYPHITTMCIDLDQSWPFGNQQFDFVLNLGTICHLTNYQQVLRHSCKVAKNIIIETEICDSDDPNRVVRIDEHRTVYDWAFNGIGHKPSAPNIENILTECGVSFKRFDNSELNSGPFKYDWKVSNTHSRKIGNRRLWIGKRDGIVAPIASKPKIILPPPNPVALTVQPEISYTAKDICSDNKGFRVAVCISGYLRSFERTFDRLHTNLLKNINADVFIHTWDMLGAPLRSFDAPLIKMNTHNVLNKINKIYNPARLVIEHGKNFPISALMHSKNTDRRDINGVLAMFYKIKACNQIKSDFERKHNFKYDCVIRIRSDLMFMTPFNITSNQNMDKLFIPFGYDYEGINDQVAYGSSAIMDQYSSIYDNIENLLREGEKLNPERLLKSHITKLNLPLERCHMHYYIKRNL